jgi:hypothetical protein
MTADERRLLRLFRSLPESRQTGLLDYGEFLLARVMPEVEPVSPIPRDIPRPAQESVVKAIKRLRETYPMLDRAKLIHETSALMSQHLMHGREAVAVIDDLEALFARHFQALENLQ